MKFSKSELREVVKYLGTKYGFAGIAMFVRVRGRFFEIIFKTRKGEYVDVRSVRLITDVVTALRENSVYADYQYLVVRDPCLLEDERIPKWVGLIEFVPGMVVKRTSRVRAGNIPEEAFRKAAYNSILGSLL